jgi:hypothetical protein
MYMRVLGRVSLDSHLVRPSSRPTLDVDVMLVFSFVVVG